MTDSVGKLFLGVQIQCAQCHNHPFTDWKQTEYWGMAAVLLQGERVATRRAAKNGGTRHGQRGRADRPARSTRSRSRPRPCRPSCSAATSLKLDGRSRTGRCWPSGSARRATRTSPRRSSTALWAQFFGRGLVNPVDDMHDENEPTPPRTAGRAGQGVRRRRVRRQVPGPRHLQQRGVPADEQAGRRTTRTTAPCSATRRSRCSPASSCTTA